MTMATGQLGSCHFQVMYGTASGADWERFADHLIDTVGPRLAPGDVVLDLWHDVGAPPAQARARFTRRFLEAPSARHVRAHALVTNSLLSRGALTAINWVIQRPFAERVFARPDEALPWLVEHAPDLDVARLRAAIEAAAPGVFDLRW